MRTFISSALQMGLLPCLFDRYAAVPVPVNRGIEDPLPEDGIHFWQLICERKVLRAGDVWLSKGYLAKKRLLSCEFVFLHVLGTPMVSCLKVYTDDSLGWSGSPIHPKVRRKRCFRRNRNSTENLAAGYKARRQNHYCSILIAMTSILSGKLQQSRKAVPCVPQISTTKQ